ncbi:MAG: DUF2642 domain-containing protein [Thermogemmatispora sp.]|nr:DUF2642 domain-containing protein [Thermogemmatispora sp.]
MEKGTDDPLLATLQESIGRVVEIETDRGEIIRGILENAGGDRAQIKTAAGRIIFIRLQRIDRCEIMNGEAEENSPASPFQQGPAAPAMRPESAQPAGGNDRPAGLPLDIERESSSPEPASQQPGVSLANACPPVEPSQPAVASPLDGYEADHQGNGAHAPHAPTPFSAEVIAVRSTSLPASTAAPAERSSLYSIVIFTSDFPKKSKALAIKKSGISLPHAISTPSK